eukprot:1781180-Prymnesium_polylepis.1
MLEVEGGKAIAEAIAVSPSLTQVLAFLPAIDFRACLHSLLVWFVHRSISLAINFAVSTLTGKAFTLSRESRQSLTP